MQAHYENQLKQSGFWPIAGADEAGRGACAGPLVAAAVILADEKIPGLNDSKKLSPLKREKLFDVINEIAAGVAVVQISPQECDKLGIQNADLQGLRRALMKLAIRPAFALTDGFEVKGLDCPSLAVWKGDQVVECIAAASIIAKVTRDRIMIDADKSYPGYGFAKHKGYVTNEHQNKLDELGPSPIHRMTYDNVRRAVRCEQK